MVRPNIPVFKPFMGKEEIKAITEVLESGWIGMGSKCELFEKNFAEYTGAKHAISLNSATAALHLALRAAGIKEGDEVITSPMTFASTVEAILYNGGVPVFADIEYGTMNISPEDIRRKITPKTRAILPVHFGGHPCDMETIITIAREKNLVVIEDAAHACGASYGSPLKADENSETLGGKKIGCGQNLTCFSFHAVKNLATGDGGMITTDNPEIDARLRKMRWMGISKDTFSREKGGYEWDYDIVEQGWKYHMNDITAAIGIEQLKKLDKMNTRRRKICDIYDKEFTKLKKDPTIGKMIEIPEVKEWKGLVHARHNYVLKIIKISKEKGCSEEDMGEYREQLIAFLGERGISVGVHYRPIYLHPRYAPYNKHNTPVTDSVWQKIITLPVLPDLTDLEALYIVRCVEDFLRGKPMKAEQTAVKEPKETPKKVIKVNEIREGEYSPDTIIETKGFFTAEQEVMTAEDLKKEWEQAANRRRKDEERKN
jgi:perosamine synthetase